MSGVEAKPGPASEHVAVGEPGDLGLAAVRACAAGTPVRLSEGLLARIAARRSEALATLAEGPEVYGVTTGMGALSNSSLDIDAQGDHSARLMLARAVCGPPWLERAEARALVAVRLRMFLEGDAAVSAELCAWLATLLEHDIVPAVPRTGSGAAGEILPLAHAWGHLAGTGRILAADGTAIPAPPVVAPLAPPGLGLKEGLSLLAGVPTATALAILRASDVLRLIAQWTVVSAGEIALLGATRDPYTGSVARADAELAEVLAGIRAFAGPEPSPRHLQAPVSFRVVGPVLAHLRRSVGTLEQVAERALSSVADSPAYMATEDGHRFVGTASFHGLDQAAAFDTVRFAVAHAASLGVARMHRMLDPGVSGLPAQLSLDPGPHTGLTPLHKRTVAAVHAIAGWGATTTTPVETSGGQEDVQTFALEAAEKLRLVVEAADQVLAAELLAVHQGRCLAPARLQAAPDALLTLLDEAAAVLPEGAADRPWGEDVERLLELLRAGWAVQSVPS